MIFMASLWGNVWKCLTNDWADSHVGVFETCFVSAARFCLYNLGICFKMSSRSQACVEWGSTPASVSQAQNFYFLKLPLSQLLKSQVPFLGVLQQIFYVLSFIIWDKVWDIVHDNGYGGNKGCFEKSHWLQQKLLNMVLLQSTWPTSSS